MYREIGKMNKTNMTETERLILLPLNYDQLVKYTKCDNSLEEELNLNKTSRTIPPELKDALEKTILPNVADKSKNYLYSTIWTAISKTENRMVGSFCLYGEPNENGEIEIGYGTEEEFQNRGYMTEIVSGIIEWTNKQSIVKFVIASTDKINIASSKVLEKNGFKKIGETDTLYNWKLESKNE
jgi:RimJ/RimL family protein N-acetyltransferase